MLPILRCRPTLPTRALAPFSRPLRLKSSTPIPDPSKIGVAFDIDGGGVTESVKAVELSSKLGAEFHPDQVVLAHSPMQSLTKTYADVPVLVLGKEECKGVALEYGFRKPCSPSEVLAWNPSMAPFSVASDKKARECECLGGNVRKEGGGGGGV
ncbi:hypothetical protein BDK51DRAFT_26793 [Blyttiomyces helicus]|uniref:Uncharacterized protein n=1 Tax=Blyttiomyces helicus TaxID=388810 RepID=A0A4P9WB43_9FUNG|nr:hypothetical protein BDK51DRAFT_26793 [Blyttiomyces helicus]|eukprot:RKO87486.1 hypothetical protein BDK51DRAFT_26793 [Blyttiomyces helicus]